MLRFRLKFETFKIVSIVALCIAAICLGLWQYKNIRFVAREYYSLNYHFTRSNVLVDRIVTPRLVLRDPESAAVLRFCLSDFSFIGALGSISDYTVSFPKNQFFLLVLASRTLSAYDGFDPEIPSKIADELIRLDPNNAYYHYLKAYSLFRLRKGTDFEPILTELEQGNSCRKMIDPYQYYKDGVISLARKAALDESCIQSYLQNRIYYTAIFLRDFRENLLSVSFRAMVNNNTTLAFRIDDDLKAFDVRRNDSQGNPFSFMSPAYIGNIAWMELQNADLPIDRSIANRQSISPAILRSWFARYGTPEPEYAYPNRIYVLSLAPGINFGQTFAGFACVFLVFCAVSIVFGAGSKYRLGLSTVLLFLIMITVCILASLLLTELLYNLDFDSGYSYLEEFSHAAANFHNFDFETALISILIVASPLLALGLLGVAYLLRPRPGKFWKFWYLRFLASLLIAVPAGLLWHKLFSSRLWIAPEPSIWIFAVSFFIFIIVAFFGGWIFKTRLIWLAAFFMLFIFVSKVLGINISLIVLFAFCFALAAVVIVLSKGAPSKFAVLKDIFARKSALRRPAVTLAFLGLCTSWIGFAILAPAMARAINDRIGMTEYKPRHESFGPQNPYQKVLARFQNDPNISLSEFADCAVLLPDDLQSVLPGLLKRKYNIWGPMGMPGRGMPGMSGPRERVPNNLQIFSTIARAPKDNALIFASGFTNPDSNVAVVGRSLAGDKTASTRLMKMFQQDVAALRNYNPWTPLSASSVSDPNSFNPGLSHATKALIKACDPNSACSLISDVIRNEPIITIDRCSLDENLPFLPDPYYSICLSSLYQRMLDSNDHDRDMLFSSVRRLMQSDSNSANAAKALSLLIAGYAEQNEIVYFGFEPYLDKKVVPILYKGLSAANPKLRAWCLWQLRRLAPDIDIDLVKFTDDPDPAVRANAVLFEKYVKSRQPDSLCVLVEKLKMH